MSEVTIEQAEEAVRTLLLWAGDNPDREGLADTPARVARMYREVFAGLRTKAPKVTMFTGGDGLVLVSDLAFSSMCEHHMVPFTGQVHVGYIPGASGIAGLSKFGRYVDWVAARPQIQEGMTETIAQGLCDILKPEALMVLVEAEHMCMSLRGVRKPGHRTFTAKILPEPDKFPVTEFYQQLHLRRRG